jgi:hypothetical protein
VTIQTTPKKAGGILLAVTSVTVRVSVLTLGIVAGFWAVVLLSVLPPVLVVAIVGLIEWIWAGAIGAGFAFCFLILILISLFLKRMGID